MDNRLSLKIKFDFSSLIIVSIKHWKCVVMKSSSFFKYLLWNKLHDECSIDFNSSYNIYKKSNYNAIVQKCVINMHFHLNIQNQLLV